MAERTIPITCVYLLIKSNGNVRGVYANAPSAILDKKKGDIITLRDIKLDLSTISEVE